MLWFKNKEDLVIFIIFKRGIPPDQGIFIRDKESFFKKVTKNRALSSGIQVAHFSNIIIICH